MLLQCTLARQVSLWDRKNRGVGWALERRGGVPACQGTRLERLALLHRVHALLHLLALHARLQH